MTKFQVILLGICVICIGGGAYLFATFKGGDTSTVIPSVTIWGTYPQSTVSQLVAEVNSTREQSIIVNYMQFSKEDFNKNFVEALAQGEGPDAVLLPQDLVLRHENKLLPIPYDNITERDFRNSYIPDAELYLAPTGILAIPFTIDPLVMYWNKTIFTNAGLATYPKYWDEFVDLTKKINEKDANSNVRKSVISMGEFVNINHARELLGTLILQAGNPVTLRGDETSGGGFVSTLGDGQFAGSQTSSQAVTFYTQFSNPKDGLYSWNRSLPTAKSWFLSGNLATYFGFASEMYDLRAKNPNINFDVAPMPQIRKGAVRTAYGNMYGFSLLKNARNASAAFTVMKILTAPDALAALSRLSQLPPVRRDMIAGGTTDPYQEIFYDAALISRSWLDSDSENTGRIFQTMVESITSGRATTNSAITTAHDELELSLKNN